MNEVMYEINYHSVGERFSHCTVTPITVVRRGILPGCARESITAIDSKGNRFQGDPADYYETESAALEAAKEAMEKTQDPACYPAKTVERLRAENETHRQAQAAIYQALGSTESDRAKWPAMIERLRADAERYRFLRDNTTFCAASEPPVLASVSERLWYHATDDTSSTTLDELADAALAAERE